ncbi:MAG: DUF4440 domain-containing protein [Myxococcales bacterium]|nr:DUF4440 domain-containing protein [Myxococcales bacterium]
MRTLLLSWCLLAPSAALAEEPDHEIHEELRQLVHQAEEAIAAGRYEEVLPLLTDDFEGTTLTQDPIRGHQGVRDYFELWFGPGGYMKSMSVHIEPDTLTDLSEDKSWGLVTGAGREHYEAKNGDTFDFDTRWTTVMERGDDGKWRVRAIHFGTNHLDNPVLWKVRDGMITWGAIGAGVLGLAAFGAGWLLGRRRSAQRPV